MTPLTKRIKILIKRFNSNKKGSSEVSRKENLKYIFAFVIKIHFSSKILTVLENDLIVFNIFYDMIRENHLFIYI